MRQRVEWDPVWEKWNGKNVGKNGADARGGRGESGEWRRDEGNEARGYLGLCRLETNVRPVKPNLRSNLLSVG